MLFTFFNDNNRGNAMLEHRWSQRLPTEVNAILRSVSGVEIHGLVRNISTGGLFIKTKSSLPVNTYVRIRFRAAYKQHPPWVGGIVVHNQGGIGLITDMPIAECIDLWDHVIVNGRRSHRELWQLGTRNAAPKL